MLFRPSAFALLVGACCVFPVAGQSTAELSFFETKIRPVLAKHCYACHSAEASKTKKLKADFALDTRAGLRKGNENGPGVVPGKPGEGLLLKALKGIDDVTEMPPSGKLPAQVIADFETWIKNGAVDPRDGNAVAVKRGMTLEEGRRFWSLVPPVRPRLPAVKDGSWAQSDIDRLVQAEREGQGLPCVGDADPRSLIRRATFDLIGLPPTPEEVEAFARNPSRAAYEKVVERLLASRHFGERWGRHWLDSARYAESNGKDRNVIWFHAWRYRDYVIQALNDDMPYDRFVREQIAGDLLPAATPEDRDRLRIATALLALGPKAFEEQKAEIFRMDVIDEQIEVVSRTVLGLSVGCARCHDHKFDPIPTRDYYALAGIFRSTQPLYGPGPLGILANYHTHTDLEPLGPEAEVRVGPAREHLVRVKAQQLKFNNARSSRYRVVRDVADANLKLKRPGADVAKLQADIVKMEAVIKEWDAKIADYNRELNELFDQPPPQPGWTLAARDRAKAEDCRVHVRGETTNLGEIVPRGVLQVLPNRAELAAQSGRLQLAEWLTARDNPLTARVYVNRVWMHLFGRGLVTTPDDFGVNGARPTHPALLDYLAVRFMEQGWSTKSLVRDLVLSRSYRLATDAQAAGLEKDPENVYLWHMSPRRLEAEIFRDAILSVSGRLDPLPPKVPFLAQFHERREEEYRPQKMNPDRFEHNSRGVYLPVIRGVLPEMLGLFDFASPDRPVAQREESSVPAQALFLMNSPWIIEQARYMARRLQAEKSLDEAGRVDLAYRLALARPARPDEMQRVLDFVRQPETLLPDPKTKAALPPEQLREERWASFCQMIFASGEFRYLR